jgi:hypothetical protein
MAAAEKRRTMYGSAGKASEVAKPLVGRIMLKMRRGKN